MNPLTRSIGVSRVVPVEKWCRFRGNNHVGSVELGAFLPRSPHPTPNIHESDMVPEAA